MRLSILQWNIFSGEDIRHIASFLKANSADVVCLQELTIQDIPHVGHTPHYIAKELGYYYHYKQIPMPTGDIDLANGIFSRYPIVSSRSKWINTPTGTGRFDDEYRAYVETAIDVHGEAITVGTTHMSYTDNGFAPTERKDQETHTLISLLKAKENRFIFTGDLNATPNSPTIQKISGILKNVGPNFSQKSWTTKPFSYNGFTETELNWRLDYIFASTDVTPLSAKIMRTEYSDHLPLWAEVEI